MNSMNNNDVEQFVNACLEVSSPVFRNKAFYDRIRNLEIDDYRLYYMKAACSYFQESAEKFAKEYIEKALSMIESDIKIGLNCIGCIKTKDEKILNALMVPQSFCQLLDVKEYSVFQLAAEIYAELSDYDNSLNMYKKFYYLVNKVAVSKELQDKSEAIVYSFRSYSIHPLEDLINNEITCVHPSKMNDPFDSIASYLSDQKKLERRCSKKKHVKPQSDCFKHFTIRSFFANRETYSDDDNILFNKLMWSHYADSHKGVCFKFDLLQDLSTFCNTVPVDYNAEYLEFDTLNGNPYAIITRKSPDWAYEHEHRTIKVNVHGLHVIKKDVLVEIIFGCRTSDEDKTRIRDLVRNNGFNSISFSEAVVNPEAYKLDIQPYNISNR